MNKININFKDRKVLFGILGVVLVCVFTLTIAYAALNAVLTISGNAQVNAANWDIHLANPNVTSGSVSNTKPVITSPSTATFSTELNMPGEFYEFTIDVVNNGSVDAMIENITKTPTLTANQAKYLKYEITYQNGEVISTKQLVSKNSFVRLKVRVEFRQDLSNSDLPTTSETLNLGLKLDYIQSDGSGSSVAGDGVQIVFANGDINEIGTIVTIGDQQFYTIGTDGDNVKLLTMYNLYVGGYASGGNWIAYGDGATGVQQEDMRGWIAGKSPSNGVTAYASTSQHGTNYSDYNGSIIEIYVNNYKDILESKYNISILEARLISEEELTNENTFACAYNVPCSSNYPFIYSSAYWTGSIVGPEYINYISASNEYFGVKYNYSLTLGVRPVIVISKDYFN